MTDREASDPVGHRLRSVALALFAMFFVFMAMRWAGIFSSFLWLGTLTLAFLGGFLLLQAGQRERRMSITFVGAVVVGAVFVSFLLYFTGRAETGGPWVPIATTLGAGSVAFGHLGVTERGMLLVGATGVLAFLVVPPETRLGDALLLACGAVLILTLALAARDGGDRPAR